MSNIYYMSNFDRWDCMLPPWVARKLDENEIFIGTEIPERFWDEIIDFPVKKMIRCGKLGVTIYYHGVVGTSDPKTGKLLKWKSKPIVDGSKVNLHPDPLRNYMNTPEDWEFTAKVITLKDIGYSGIKKQYPRVYTHSNKLAGLIGLSRPLTLVAPFVCGILGVLIERFYTGGSFTIPVLILVGICLALCQAIGQISNQVCDVDIDRINKPYRPLVAGTVSRRTAVIIFSALIIINIVIAFSISITFGSFILMGMILALTYSFEPVRVKSIDEWAALIWMALARGFIPFVATWSVYGDVSTNALPVQLGIFAFLWVFAFQATKDFPDVKGDVLHNIPTLPAEYGEKQAVRIMSTMAILPFMAAIFWGLTGLLLLVPVALIILISCNKNVKSDRFENNFAWIGFYAGLGLIYVVTLVMLL